MPYETGASVIQAVNALSNNWQERRNSVSKWYKLIRLENDLAQPRMESVISNDPRTSFDLARWLLQPKIAKFIVSQRGFRSDQLRTISQLESYALEQYNQWVDLAHSELYGSQVDRLLSFMLATGWYALGCMPQDDGSWMLQTFHPFEFFPEYDEGGCLVRLGRSYTVSPAIANMKVLHGEWVRPERPWTSAVAVRTIWEHQPDGVYQVVSIGNHIARPYSWTPFLRIPIYTGPVPGLPDTGQLGPINKWKGEIAQSVVTAIADVQKNMDRMLTYMQQLLRDTAEPRILEILRGNSVVTQETWYSRGAVYTVEPGEDIRPIQPPVMPPELRSHEFDLRSMLSKGTFSDTSYGLLGGGVNSILFSQVVASAQRVLSPFRDTLQWLLGQAALFNFVHMKEWGIGLDGTGTLSFPDTMRVSFKYDITIPGDFVQRASTARVLNPEFRLSTATIYENLFPEIQSAIVEEGRLSAEDAAKHPVFRTLMTIVEFNRAAAEARQMNNGALAERLQRAAALMEQQLFQPTQPGDNAPALAGGFPPEGMPPVVQELLSGR